MLPRYWGPRSEMGAGRWFFDLWTSKADFALYVEDYPAWSITEAFERRGTNLANSLPGIAAP